MPWSRESRHKRGYGSAWDKARKGAIQRDKGLCVPCLHAGRTRGYDAVDHITPKAQGGTDDLDNLQCICNDCHKIKTQAESKPADTGMRFGDDGWPV